MASIRCSGIPVSLMYKNPFSWHALTTSSPSLWNSAGLTLEELDKAASEMTGNGRGELSVVVVAPARCASLETCCCWAIFSKSN